MYKMLIFLKGNKDEKVYEHFSNFTVKYLSQFSGKEIKIGKVESSLLLETKYSHFCEFMVDSKKEMDELLNSPESKAFNNDLMNFNQEIDLIFIDYA